MPCVSCDVIVEDRSIYWIFASAMMLSCWIEVLSNVLASVLLKARPSLAKLSSVPCRLTRSGLEIFGAFAENHKIRGRGAARLRTLFLWPRCFSAFVPCDLWFCSDVAASGIKSGQAVLYESDDEAKGHCYDAVEGENHESRICRAGRGMEQHRMARCAR